MSSKNQQGMVLLVSLILLLMLTLVAITASTQSSLQLRISSNNEQNNSAFQAAEAGLAIWTRAYLFGQSLPTQGVVGDSQAYTVIKPSPNESSEGPCLGFGLGFGMGCAEVQVGVGCDANGTDCTTVHVQGVRKRDLSKQNN